VFTLFDLIRLFAILVGSFLLGTIGWNKFGVVGCILGVPLGFVIGAIVGRLPLIIVLKCISRRFDRMTNDELIGELHSPTCLIPNILLLELKRRGYNVQTEIPFVQTLLVSDEMHRRTAGWAALTSVFPELVGRIPNYNPTATASDCQLASRGLLDATEQSAPPKSPVGRDFES
jgi:hypothetical protein